MQLNKKKYKSSRPDSFPKSNGFWKSQYDHFFSVISGILATIVIHWNIISTKALPGDTIDARATIVTYEHWFMFFKGESGFREIPVFFPTKNLISSSDAVLSQGTIYSAFRFLGMDQTLGLKATIIFVTLLGFIGVGVLAKMIFKDNQISVGITALTVTSYQVVAQSGHLQTWLYFSLAWILVFLINICRGVNLRLSFGGLLIGMPLLALSTWYTIIGILWFSSLIFLYLFIRDRKVLTDCLAKFKNSGLTFFRAHTKFAILTSGIFSLQTLTFMHIYLGRIGDQEFGGWPTTFFYSPRLFDLFNASFGSTGWEADFYDKAQLSIYPTAERAMGLSIPIIVLIIFGFIHVMRRKQSFTLVEKSIVFSIVTTFVIPLTDERGQSFWYFVSKIPVLNSIRTPARLWTFASILVSWLIVWIIWKGVKKCKSPLVSRLILVIIIGILSVAQIRPPLANWKENDLLSDFGKSSGISILKNDCEIFYLSSREDLGLYGSIVRQIDGMLLAVSSNKKTINGYTSSAPIGWPQRPVWGLVTKEDLMPWINANPAYFLEKTCFIDEDGISIYNSKTNKFEAGNNRTTIN
jgi:hypothetical protein